MCTPSLCSLIVYETIVLLITVRLGARILGVLWIYDRFMKAMWFASPL